MIEITLSHHDLALLRNSLLNGIEECAVLFASQTTRADGLVRLLVRECQLAVAADYISHDADHVTLQPSFLAAISKRARRENLSLVFVHSHGGLFAPHFSRIDDEAEQHLSGFLHHRVPDRTHAAMVISRGGIRARQLGTNSEARVISLGEIREIEFDPGTPIGEIQHRYDRQVRAFGEPGQHRLQQLRVAVVGLGGTGSIVAQHLVHLGVRQFILIDPDVLEATNLNRVVNASPPDLGATKVDIAARYIKTHAPESSVVPIVGDVIRVQVAKHLAEADFIFCCTDSHGSRSILQQIAYQYFIPCIDVGTIITTSNGAVTGIFGRTQLLAPTQACLSCSGLLNSEEVRRDMMSTYERKLDPYIQGEREPAPAVISLNGTVVSLAITMMMAYVAGVPSPARYLVYNAKFSTLRSVKADANPQCFICSRSGVYARGDAVQLFGRLD